MAASRLSASQVDAFDRDGCVILMHFSTDNQSSKPRTAMVYHYAPSSTHDHTVETRGYTVNDWMPVGAPAAS